MTQLTIHMPEPTDWLETTLEGYFKGQKHDNIYVTAMRDYSESG